MVAGRRSRSERFKEQATRLRSFLADGGIEIKHTHALEAVARMHGAKDWHVLMAAGEEAEPSAAPATEPQTEQQYAVVTSYKGHASVALANGRALALRNFLQESRMLVDLLGSDSEVLVIGQDIDSGLPQLALTLNGVAITTLLRPALVDDKAMVKDRKGAWKEVPAQPIDLLGLDAAESFYAIGVALTNAFASRRKEEEKARQSAALNSMAARMLSFDFNEALPELAAESRLESNPPPIEADPRQLLLAIDKIRLMHRVMATIRGGQS